MSLLDQASLVLVPSAIKTGEVLVQKPLPTKFSDETGNYDGNDPQGSANLTFTRNSNATRVNADGLVEKVRTNELLYSNDFSNAYWAKSGVTLTAGQSDADGGNNAWKIDFASGANSYLGKFSMGSTQTKTNSIWLRADSPVQIGFNNGQSSNAVTLTTSWVRYSVTQLGTSNAGLQLDNYFGVSTPQLAVTFYAYQAQNEVSDFGPTDYIPTTTAAVSVGPVANLPRLNYPINSDGSVGCPSLLLEPQRTNLVTYSEQFNNAAWIKGFGGVSTVNVTANYAISPDGYQNADRIQLTRDAAGFAQIAQTVSVTSGQVYTFSVYLKSLSGTPTIMFGSYGGTNAQTATLTNEWVRYTWTATTPSTSAFPMLMIWGGVASTSLSADFLAYGYQFELGSYATSYIPTLGASVTRLADAFDNQLTPIETAFTDNTKGTIFFDLDNLNLPTGANAVFRFGNSVSSLQFAMYFDTYGLGIYSYNGGSYIILTSPSVKKLAIRFDGTQIVGFSNGVKRTTYNAPASFDIDRMSSNHTASGSFVIKQFILFPELLTDAQLAELTTL